MEKNTPKLISAQHKKFSEYKSGIGIGLELQTKKNERFFNGDQWLGKTTSSDLPLIQYNMIERIGLYKLSQLISNPLTANFTAEGIPNTEEMHKIQDEKTGDVTDEFEEITQEIKTGDVSGFNNLDKNSKINYICSALTDYFVSTSERLSFNMATASVALNAYISGTGAIYSYWDETIKTGLYAEDETTPIDGDVNIQVLDAENQLDFENPAEKDIQKQDWIIISQKMTVAEAKRIATRNGTAQKEIEAIKANDSDFDYSSERDENTTADTVNRVLVLTKIYKDWSKDYKDYTLKAIMVTDKVVIRDEWDIGLKRYPISLFRWKELKNCIFGDSEVTHLISNQIALNKMATASVWSAMLNGMPKMVINGEAVTGTVTNNPGEIIKIKGTEPLGNVVGYIQPPQISTALVENINEVLNNTLQNSGANDAALGNINPDNATALIISREAATAPMQMFKNRFYQFVEDTVRNISEIWFNLFGNRKLKISDKSGVWYLPFNAEEFKNTVLSVKIDVGAATIWTQASAQQTLDTLLQNQIISPTQYLERLPKGTVTDITGLIKDAKEAEAQAKAAAEAEQNAQNNIDSMNNNDIAASLAPEKREAWNKLDSSQQQSIIERAKEESRKAGNGNVENMQ